MLHVSFNFFFSVGGGGEGDNSIVSFKFGNFFFFFNFLIFTKGKFYLLKQTV